VIRVKRRDVKLGIQNKMSERMLSRWLRSLNTIVFQSLIGSLNNCNPAAAITYRSNTVYKFQSLIGSLSNCNISAGTCFH